MLRQSKDSSFRNTKDHKQRRRDTSKGKLQDVHEGHSLHSRQRKLHHRICQQLLEPRTPIIVLLLLLVYIGSISQDASNSAASRDLAMSVPLASQRDGVQSHTGDNNGNTPPLPLPHTRKSADEITAAVCYKTLFGDIDLGLVIQWATYNRLLGFDHVFMWYRPEMETAPRFEELKSLPYVTLTLNTDGTRKDYYHQWYTEKKCLKQKEYAGSYDWALLADVDEFLWFPEQIGVKDFLERYHQNMTYLSFGKQMYTLDHRVAEEGSFEQEMQDYRVDTTREHDWPVAHYPFYLPHFCYHQQRRGDPYCPTWRGRAKIMVKPTHHQQADVHGTILHPDPQKGSIHFDPDTVAHFKEWPGIFAPHNVTMRPAKRFAIYNEYDVHIHNLWRAFKPASIDMDGTKSYIMQHDSSLHEWFDYVKSRASP